MPISKSTYKDQVIDFIYDTILKGRLKPGDRVPEQWLAETLAISRAPIREALRQLEKEGLLSYRPQAGSSVAHLSARQILDTYRTRGVLEGFAAKCAADLFTDKDFRKLEHLIERMIQAAKKNQHQYLSSIDKTFHEYIYTKSGNKQLIEFANTLSTLLHIIFCQHWTKVYNPDHIRRRHQLILDTLKEGDAHSIEDCIRNHYEETGRMMTQFGSDQT